VPLAGTGTGGRNQGTNVDTAASLLTGGPAVLGALIAGLAVTTTLVFGARLMANRRRSSQE
jgi:hypothetical protein